MGGALSSLMGGGKPKTPTMPVIEAPPPVPIPEPVAPVLMADDDALTKARKKKLQAATARSGRDSTILSTGDDLLGS